MSGQPITSAGANEQAEIDAALLVLRDGTRAEKIAARERLARIFERRDLLEYAAECLEANVLDGVRDPLLYERLASIYDRQGDGERADQARTEARKLIERRVRSGAAVRAATALNGPASAPTAQLRVVPTRRLRRPPPKDDPLGSLLATVLDLPPRLIMAGAGAFLTLGLVLLVVAALYAGKPADRAIPTPELAVRPGVPTPDAAHVDPTVVALIGQIAQVQATAEAARVGSEPTPAAPTPARPIGGDATRAVEALRAVPAFVITNSGSGSAVSLGGGRFVTNYHVVDDASVVAIRLADGRTERAEVRSVDSTRDLALLQTPFTDVPAARFRVSTDLQPAENLYVVGYPRGTQLGVDAVTVTRGIFSARRQARNDVWHVQTDAPMNPGNSGGPVGDGDGNVVGLATWGLRDSNGLNFAVASDEVTAFLEGGGSAPAASRSQPVAPSKPSVPSAPAVAVRPQLTGATFGPAGVEPGGSVGLTYEIVNTGTVPVSVVLGASIRLGSGAWIDDTSNDARVRVTPGRKPSQRSGYG